MKRLIFTVFFSSVSGFFYVSGIAVSDLNYYGHVLSFAIALYLFLNLIFEKASHALMTMQINYKNRCCVFAVTILLFVGFWFFSALNYPELSNIYQVILLPIVVIALYPHAKWRRIKRSTFRNRNDSMSGSVQKNDTARSFFKTRAIPGGVDPTHHDFYTLGDGASDSFIDGTFLTDD